MKFRHATKLMLVVFSLYTFIPGTHAQTQKTPSHISAPSIANHTTDKISLIKPDIRDGRYYNSIYDTHNHLGSPLFKKLTLACISLPKKLLSHIVSYFYQPNSKHGNVKLNVTLHEPTQTVPLQTSIKPRIIWIGWASFLIQIGGFNILTDPILDDLKVGPVTMAKREWAPGITLNDLPPIDAIVISHNHVDHTDSKSLSALAKKHPNAIVLVPEGDKPLFTSMGFKTVHEKTWWQKHSMTKNNQTITITFLPAKHWSVHLNPFKYRKSLWGSWMISCNNTNIYFAGDSAYADHFKQIAQVFPKIDVALMPIGPTDENHHNKHKETHVNAKEAIDAFVDLNANCFIPMHWGTFFRAHNTYEYPINQLNECWNLKRQAGSFNEKLLMIMHAGQQIIV